MMVFNHNARIHEKRKMLINNKNQFVFIGVGVALFIWFAEVALHIMAFGTGNFAEELHSLNNSHELWMRIVIVSIVLLAGIIAQKTANRIHENKKHAIAQQKTHVEKLLKANEKVKEEISEREKAEDALKENRERMELALKGADLGMWDYYIQSDELILDERSIELLGAYPKNEAEVDALIHPDDVKPYDDAWDAVLEGREVSYTFEYRLKNPSSQYKWLMDKGKVVERGSNGEPTRATGTLQDITKQKRAEEEKIKLESQLQQSQKMEAIGTLAGGIAHLFNNALSVTNVNLDMLEMDHPGDEKIANYTKHMKASAQRMTQLTSQLLAYARGGKYQARTLAINDFIDHSLPIIHHSISPDTSIETDLTTEVLNIKADQTQMQMVLSAILINASEAIEGTGHIRISTKKEEIDEAFTKYHPDLKPGPHVCLTVEDNGKGMDKETRDRIFEPFFTTKFEGRGLGMASAFGIVKNHDGLIYVYSETGKGTVVRIYLPLLETKAEKPKVPKAEPLIGNPSGFCLRYAVRNNR